MNNENSTQVLVELRDITKVFYTDSLETRALDGVSLSIHRGDYLCISGPSGCGKTTLLSIIGMLETPSSGRYLFKGQSVDSLADLELARVRNREIGFVFQSFNLIGNLTVWENVELPLTYRGIGSRERKRRVDEALARVKLSHRAGHFPSQLSGGQQQRAAVARALAGNPAILLCDEPTGNLDSKNGEQVMGLIEELYMDGATICMVTHDERFASMARRSIHLFDGKVLQAQGGLVPSSF